jgi:hypothetical protein
LEHFKNPRGNGARIGVSWDEILKGLDNKYRNNIDQFPLFRCRMIPLATHPESKVRALDLTTKAEHGKVGSGA